ncbi:N-lysine methyltransferase KMT5A-A-like [Apostichopus japonicus]|uniref:N-lysine methyltransferase KMT5A-A-like n=1 Tax=Stichopus japonicus TaxID=307972 RepID=UPI003AB1762D
MDRSKRRGRMATAATQWIRNRKDPPGINIRYISEEVAYGVFAERQFVKGYFLFQYPGLLKNSEDVEEQDQTYIFHFKENGRNLCYDATLSERLGRYANDEWRPKKAGGVVKKVYVDNIPIIAVYCLNNIEVGDEIRFDYGQPDSEWRLKMSAGHPGTVKGKVMETRDVEVAQRPQDTKETNTSNITVMETPNSECSQRSSGAVGNNSDVDDLGNLN